MKGMLLAAAWTNYVIVGVLVVLLLVMFIMMNARNKKESQKVQEQTNSLKVGDKIMTTSGVYGTITEINYDDTKKTIVIETGGKTKSFMTIDAYAVYTVFKSDEELAREAEEARKLAEATAEPSKEEVKEEPKPAKPAAKKKTAKKD